MRSIATDVAWSVGVSVCLSRVYREPCKTNEHIEMPSGLWTHGHDEIQETVY